MKITDEFKKSYEAYLKSYLPESIIQNENFRSSISESLEELAELSTSEVCMKRKKGLNLDCNETVLAERILKLSDGTEFVAGARFKNLDKNFPFVAILKTKSISLDQLKEFQSIIETDFKNLKPKGFLFKDKPNLTVASIFLCPQV